MAQFPYIYQTGFESGAVDTGGAETDTGSKGSYVHYVDLQRKYGFLPWRGAYCYLIDQTAGNTTEVIQTVAGFDVSASNYWSFGFAFYAKNTEMANGDRSTIAACKATATNEVTLQLYYTTAAGLQLLLTETASTAVGSNPVCSLSENEWHWIEMYGKVDAGGGNDGTAYLVVDGNAIGNIGSLDQGAFTDLIVGLTDIDAGHNNGYYAFDDIYVSGVDTSAVRIGYRSRFSMTPHVSAIATSTYGEHIFLGPGTLREVTLLTAAAGDLIRVYDTDRAYSSGDYGPMISEANFSSGYPVIAGPLEFQRGCYVKITAAGAAGARGVVSIDPAPCEGYSKALYYGNEANLKRYAMNGRKELPGSM